MAASAARGSLGTVLGACLSCDQPQPPPEPVGRTALSPLPGSREGRVRRGSGMGARQPPTSLMLRLGSLKGSHPAPTLESPFGKLTRCVTPISMLCGEQAAGLRVRALGARHSTCTRVRRHGQGPAPPSRGHPEEPGRLVPRELPPPQSKVGCPLPPSLLSS